MVHGYTIETWISICVFSINGYFGMNIAWTLEPGLKGTFSGFHFVAKPSVERKEREREKKALNLT